MRRLALAGVLAAVAGCAQSPRVQTNPTDDLSSIIPDEIFEELSTALGGAEYKAELQGPVLDPLSSDGFVRITDIDCGAIFYILANPEAEISGDLRAFLEELIQDGNAEIENKPRMIAVCSSDSFDPGAFGS